MKIMLFDIDGTILKSNIRFQDGRHMSSFFKHSIKKVFGIDSSVPTGLYGWTDKAIFLYVGENIGISREEIENHMEELVAASTAYVGERITNSIVEPAEGITELLETLKSKGYHLGLLTGNIKEIAEMKLGKVDLYKYFEFGGFGTVSEIRSKLIDHAIVEAEQKFGTRIGKKEVFYFGDAIKDIEAGRAAGVVMISVATGHHTVEQLGAMKPDYLLKDLSDTSGVLKIIEGK